MALDLGELAGTISMDIRPLERQLAEGDRALSDFARDGARTARLGAQDIADQYGIGLADVARLMDTLPQDAQGAVDQTSQAFRDLPPEVQQVAAAIEADVDALLNSLGPDAQRAAQDASAGIRTGLNDVPNHARRAADDAVDQLGQGLNDAQPTAEAAADDAGEGFGRKFTTALKGAGLAAGAALMAAVATGASGAQDIEVLSDRIGAQFRLTEAEARVAGEAAADIYAGAWGESLDEVSGAVSEVMAAFGIGPAHAELQDLTAAGFTLADVFDVDVSLAVQAAGTAVRNDLANNGMEAFDLLAAAGRGLSGEVFDEMLNAVREYGTAIGGMGLDAQTAFAAMRIGAETQGAIGVDRVGDAFNEVNIRVSQLDTNSTTAFATLGLNAEDMAARFQAGGTTAREAFDEMIDGLLAIEDPALQAQTAVQLFGTPFEDLGSQQIPALLTALDNGGAALDDFGGAATEMGNQLSDNATGRITAFKRELEMAVVEFIGNEVIPRVVELADTIEEYAGPAFDAGREAIEEVVPVIQDFIDEVERVVEENGPALEEFGDNLGETFSTLAGAVATITQTVTILWGVFGDNVLGSTLRTFGNIGTIIQGALDVVAGIIGFWTSVFTGDFDAAFEFLKQGWSGAWSIVTGIFWQAVELITAPVRALASALGIDTNRMWGQITGAASRGVSSVVGWFGRMKDGAVDKAWLMLDWMGGLPGLLLDKFSGAGTLLYDVGKDIVTGMWNGLMAMGDWLKDQLWDWIKDVVPGPVKLALGIESPSRVMRDLMKWVPAGMALGLEDGAPLVDAAVADLSARAGAIEIPGEVGLTAAIAPSSTARAGAPRARTRA
ncbi:hypothetical protein [Nocardioides zeae]